MKQLKQKRIGPNNRETRRLERLVDNLGDYEDFKQTMLRALRADIKDKMTPKAIREKYAAILQGRIVTEALTTDDAALAHTITKDILDRVEGKATEKKEVTHKFKDLTDNELDAVLASEEEDLKDMQEKFNQ